MSQITHVLVFSRVLLSSRGTVPCCVYVPLCQSEMDTYLENSDEDAVSSRVLIDVLTDYLHIHRGGRQHQSIYQYQNIISIQYSVSSRVGFCMSFFKNQCSFENKMKGLAIPCPPIPNGNPAARPMSQARLLRSALSTFKKSNSLHADAGMMGWR